MKFSAWKFGYSINISDPSSTEGSPAVIDLPWKPGMMSDFRDIRFADTYGVELKHYRESYTAFSTAKFWIKLPANENKIIMYYGNGGVASASSGSDVFEFWNDFDSLSTSVWTVGGVGHSISNSILTIQSSIGSGYIESKTTFAPGSLVEMRVAHQSGQRGPFGFRSANTEKAAAWQGAAGGLLTDHLFAHNGSSGDWDDDGVNRSGAAYNIYGVAQITAGPKYYVNYSYRGEITTTEPGAVNLPIQFYAYSGEGYLKVDWVRIRQYSATEPTLTLGNKFVQSNNGFLQQHDYISDSVTTYVYSGTSIKDYYTDPVSTKISTGFAIGAPDQVTDSVSTSLSTVDTIIDRTKLSDYSLVSCTVSKTIDEAYIQLSAEFADTNVPQRGVSVKHYGADNLIFQGKVISNSPSLNSYYKTNSMMAADNSRNLAVQPIPWNWQVISLEGEYSTWALWLAALIDYNHTGVNVIRILDSDMPDHQFSFDPKTTRWEAIKKICDYCGLIPHIKLVTEGTQTYPGFYAVPASEIDLTTGGFDLPSPIRFTDKNVITLVDQPKIVEEPDEFYNTVIVYGTITSTGETTVSKVYTPNVQTGFEKERAYTVQDNAIEEKGSTAEIEAIRWLLYFNTPRATVTAKFIQRFDFELYQRLAFSGNFPAEIRKLSSSSQLVYVVCCDPRDEINSTHTITVSGVPTPNWLRVTGIKYQSVVNDETVELTLVTDYIYSSADWVISEPYNSYIAPGYRKPISDDSAATIQDVVNNTVEKQLTPEICTVLSKDEENLTMVVQTQSGKLVTVRYG